MPVNRWPRRPLKQGRRAMHCAPASYQPRSFSVTKLLASLIVAACSTLAANAIAATDKTDDPTAATHHDKKAKKSHDAKSSTHSSAKKTAHKSDAKPSDTKAADGTPADAKPAEATK
jgi:hypothetical protein